MRRAPLRSAAAGGPDRHAEWAALGQEIQACTRCPLHVSRTHVVIYRGGERPRVVFVGEAPGAEEDRVGRPFVGRSGARLDEAIRSTGLSDGEYGVLNLVKCRPPSNRLPIASIAMCRPFLDRQLAILRPELVVTLGRFALRAFDPDAPPILECAGTERGPGGRGLFPLLHPAAPLHAPRLRSRWESDVVKLGVRLGRTAAVR